MEDVEEWKRPGKVPGADRASSGDYIVRAGASDRVRVQWRADDPDDQKDMRKIRVVSDVFEGVATIRTKSPTNRARFTIEVPARSDVHLRVRAGDIRIEGIEKDGFKNSLDWFGDGQYTLDARLFAEGVTLR